MDAPFIRDEENEERMAEIIFEKTLGVNSDGEDSGGEDDDFSEKCLNDSGEGLELEEIRDDDEVPLANSGEVYIYIKSLLITRCIN